MSSCVFCEIVAGRVAADVVVRDERSIAFLDRSPLFRGHVLVVPIDHVVSQSVAHLHAHVVPRRRKDGLRGFFWPREKYIDESDAAAIAARIRSQLTS